MAEPPPHPPPPQPIDEADDEDGELGLLLAMALDPHPSQDSHQAARDLGGVLTARLTVRVCMFICGLSPCRWIHLPNSIPSYTREQERSLALPTARHLLAALTSADSARQEVRTALQISLHTPSLSHISHHSPKTQRVLGLVGWDLFEALLPWARAGSTDKEGPIFEVLCMYKLNVG